MWAWQQGAWAIQSDIVAILTLGTAGTLLYLGTLALLAGAEVRRTFSAILGPRPRMARRRGLTQGPTPGGGALAPRF